MSHADWAAERRVRDVGERGAGVVTWEDDPKEGAAGGGARGEASEWGLRDTCGGGAHEGAVERGLQGRAMEEALGSGYGGGAWGAAMGGGRGGWSLERGA